ncbi:AAA family ATPase [Paenarthrobacter sp. DKR-5]|nr:AAA family ATPase [Paenarthrobacter sp. DKR-5]
MSRYLTVTTDPDYSQRVASAATGELAGEIHLWQGEAFPHEPGVLLAQLPGGALPEVVLLGPGVPLEEALQLASGVDRLHPDVSVLLITPEADQAALAAMRAGVRDVLTPDAELQDLTAVLHRAVQASQVRRRAAAPLPGGMDNSGVQGRIIAVVSPKGGAGKTTVATNLAVGLAASAPHSTVLVDLDLQFGDVASAMRIASEQSLAEAVRGAARSDTMVLKSYLSAHPSGVYVLAAPDSPAAEADISPADVAHLLEQLAAQYRFIIVDTAPGLSEHTLAALDRSTDFVFVGGLDVPSVRGLRKELDVLRALGMIPAAKHIVLNGADPRDGLSAADVEQTLGQKPDVVIPFSRGVRLSTNQGVPLLLSRKKDRATKELRRLISRFTPAPVAAPKRRSKARHRIGAL